jgi:radical SAM protein with 4Fe4S-binding SPASM domain
MKLKYRLFSYKDKCFLHIIQKNLLLPLKEDICPILITRRLPSSFSLKVLDKPWLNILQWHLTERCNLRCLHCYVNAKSNNYSYSEFSYDEAVKLVDEAEDLGVVSVNLTGGEPLLLPYITSLINYIYDKGLSIEGVFTNGTIIPKDLPRLCGKYDKLTFYVSLDGLKRGHDSLRGIPSFERVVRNIRILKEHNCRVCINTMLFKGNINEMESLHDLLLNLNVDGWRVSTPQIFGRWKENYEALSVSINEEFDVYERLLEKHLASGASFYLELGYVVRFINGKFWIERYDDESLVCWYFANQLTIWPDGTASPCPWLPINIGNVKKEGLRVVWERALPYKKLRVLDIKECLKCTHRQVCGAGCRARAMAFSGSLLDKDPLSCNIYGSSRFFKIYDYIRDSGYPIGVIDVPKDL